MHRKFAVVLAALALALAATGCRATKHDALKTTGSDHATTTTSTTVALGTPTTAGADGSATTVGGQARGATATTGAGHPSGAPATTAGNPNAAPAPAAPGTYDYTQSGSASQGSIPPSGTLVVSGSGPSQVFQRNAGSYAVDIYYVFRSDGPFITQVVLHEGPATITCSFASAVPAPPWPPTVGRSFAGHATCNNNQFAADFSGSITAHGSDSVGGRSFETDVINSTLHITGSGFDVTVKDTEHWAPALRVPTFSHEVVNGTTPFGPFTADVTSMLVNSTPR